MRKNDFIRNIYSKEIGGDIKGFLSSSIINALRSDPNRTEGFVKQGMEYRPDKLSAYYYGTTDYDWVILAVNTTKGLEDLTLGKKLVIPSSDRLLSLGVINAL
jgi:hypothetical protein